MFGRCVYEDVFNLHCIVDSEKNREFCQVLMKDCSPKKALTTASIEKWMKFLTQQNAHGGKLTYLVTWGIPDQMKKTKHRMLPYCSTSPDIQI